MLRSRPNKTGLRTPGKPIGTTSPKLAPIAADQPAMGAALRVQPAAAPIEVKASPPKSPEVNVAHGEKQAARQKRKLQEEQAKQDRKAREAEAKYAAKASKAAGKAATRTERASHSGERAAAIGGAISSSFEAVGDVAGAYMETLGAPGDAMADAMSDMDDDSDVGSTKERPSDTSAAAGGDPVQWLKDNPIAAVAGLAGAGLLARKMGWI